MGTTEAIVAFLVVCGLFAGIVVFGRSYYKGERAAIQVTLTRIANAKLKAAVMAPEGNAASGTYGDVGLDFRYAWRRSGKHQHAWTEVRVRTARTPLTISLRSERDEADNKARGLAVDVVTGDPAFDDLYLVEAAPFDVAVALFDAQLRAKLVALAPLQIKTTGPGEYLLEVREHAGETRLETMIDAAGLLGNCINAAYEAADAQAAQPVASPYRGETDARPAAEVRQRREEEVAKVAQVQATRQGEAARAGTLVTVLIVVGVLGLALIGYTFFR